MSKLLEIFGRAITVDTADLICHWFNAVKSGETSGTSAPYERLDKIIELIDSMKTESAAEQLELYLFANPSCCRGRLAAAAIYLHKNQLHNAVEQLNLVYQRQPNNTMALYALGHCYERLGREEKSVEFYQDCLKFKNYLQLPRQRLAAIYLKNGQLEKTILEYELLKSEYPDDISTLITLGHLYIADKKYSKAVETFNTAILVHPDVFYNEDDQAEQLIADDQLREAAERLEDLLREQPERADLIARHADVLAMMGATNDAVSQYQQAIHICPDLLEATIKLGTQYLQLNAEQSAAQQFNRAVEINDQIVDAYIGLAMAQKLAGDISGAFTTLSLASAIQPNSSLLFAHTAALQFRAGLRKKSLSCDIDDDDLLDLVDTIIVAHHQQIARRPQNPDLHYRLGLLLMSVGKMNHAIRSFQTALEINPTYTRARCKLVVCLLETDHKNLAIKELIGPDCLDKDTLDLHYRTALLYCDRIKFASSLINLEQQMQNNFTSADATVNISIILQNLGLLDRAAAMWDNLEDTTKQAINSNLV